MAEIRVDSFGGRIPRLSDRLLPQENSTVCNNCKLFSGELRGWKYPLSTNVLNEVSTVLSTFRLPGTPDYWMRLFTDNVHVLKSPLTNDGYNRVYWSSGVDDVPRYNTEARIRNDDPAYRLGIPTPTRTITVTPIAGGVASVVTRAYTFTYVNDLGEESAPASPVTASNNSDGTWSIGNLGTNMATDIPNVTEMAFSNGVAVKRLYRTITGTSGNTTFFFVADIPINTGSYNDTSSDEDIAYNSLLPSSGWDEPPAELEGIVAHPSGFLVGYVGNDLYFSEPYRPHAWPTKYILSTDYPIMGLGVVGTTIGVVTQSAPYTCGGTNPSAMAFRKTNTVEPCMSKKGVVTLPDGIYYPSNNGLAFLTTAGASIVTQTFMTKEEWQLQYSPGTINATRYGTRYLGYISETVGFIFDPSETRIAIVDLVREDHVTDIFTDVYDGQVYFLSNNTVYEWDPSEDTPPIAYEWQSKIFEFTKPVNIGAGIVKFNDSSFTIDASYIDSVQAINDVIVTAAPVSSAWGSKPFNGTQTVVSYSADLSELNLYQSGAIGGSDIQNIPALSIQSANTAVTVWADERLVFSSNVVKNQMFRMPAGFKAHTWQYKISSNTDVYSIAFAETAKGLMKV